MNVQELLEDIDLLAPNSFSTSRKVTWMNQVQYQVSKELETSFSNRPLEIKEDQLSFVPRLQIEYHELLSLGVAKRVAERTQEFKMAGELEIRFQNLLTEAKVNTAPKTSKVVIKRNWI